MPTPNSTYSPTAIKTQGCLAVTDKFIVGVYLLENQKYRYASWSKGSDI